MLVCAHEGQKTFVCEMSGILDRRLSHVVISAETICAEELGIHESKFSCFSVIY